MAKPNNARCPRCRAKLHIDQGMNRVYTCRRCGYYKAEEPDNMTKEFMWGPLYKTKGRSSL